jgi:signal transduction histidine kinase/ActR/RegA family two-component response regulator
MSASRDPSEKFDLLRRQAQALLKQQPQPAVSLSADTLELINELRIHQAELEIQNEELRQAQIELSGLQREFEDLYEFAPCGYITLNPKGIISRINLNGAKLISELRKRVINTGFSQYIAPGWEDVYLHARRKAGQSGEKQTIELPLKTDRGSFCWVRTDIKADRAKDDAVLQWRMVLVDITEKAAVEAALRQSEEKYRKMMESLTDPVYVCSPNMTVEYMNRAMIDRLGRDATGETCHKAIHGRDEKCDWCKFDKVRNGQTVEISIQSPKDHRSYRITNMPILNDDKTVSKLTIFRDITDFLKAIEEKEYVKAQLAQARKIESIGNLAGGIAHDFNNILASIIGFTELALEEVENGTTQQDNLQEIYTAGKRARNLVKQILTFARQAEQETRPVKVRAIAREALGLLRSSISTSIEIKSNLQSDSLVMGTATQIHQILLNLCTNAAQAMEDGGVLEIGLNDIYLEGSLIRRFPDLGPGDFLEISVTDTGKGIAPDVIDSIFEPYFTTKAPGEGTGMGLATTHGLVKGYGGEIMVESRPGEGTVFKIYLPVVRKRVAEKLPKVGALPTGSERILLVDDELPIAKMGGKILERLGYAVTTCTSSVTALELFKTNPEAFDLVLTDMAMPNMTGDKLSVELMKIRPDIPVVLCTGFSRKISDETVAGIGIKGFVHKPVAKADLAKIIRKVLDEVQKIDPAHQT